MYQLDLSDPRLALPVAIYQSPARPEAAGSAGAEGRAERAIADGRRSGFLRAGSRGIATLPVYEEYDTKTGQTLRVGTSGQPGDAAGPACSFSCFRPT